MLTLDIALSLSMRRSLLPVAVLLSMLVSIVMVLFVRTRRTDIGLLATVSSVQSATTPTSVPIARRYLPTATIELIH